MRDVVRYTYPTSASVIRVTERRARAIRISDAGADTIRRLAEEEAVPWSEAARLTMAWGALTMPLGWRPELGLPAGSRARNGRERTT